MHRDIKPSNVIFVNGVAKLGDIGLVTDAGDTQSIVGTEGYLPPEGPGTPQADLYSLGKVLYEISTGMDRRRFSELPEDLPSWPERKAVIEFNEIVLKACAKDSARRYSSAADLRADLELLQRGRSVKRARSRARWKGITAKTALVAAALGILVALVLPRLTPQRQNTSADGPASTNDLANAFCTKALMNLRFDSYSNFEEVYTNLHKAIALDSHFARPYIGLLELRSCETVTTLPPPSAEEMRTIAEKLNQLAPNSAATLCAQSLVRWFEWDFPLADELARRAIQVNPNYEFAHRCYGHMLVTWDRPIEARNQLEICRRLLPSKVTTYRTLGHTYFVERDFTNAIAVYRQALGWESHHEVAYACLGFAYQAIGDYTNAIACLEKSDIESGDKPSEVKARYDGLRAALASGGPSGYWMEQWKQTEKNPEDHFQWKAQIQCRLGNTNAALAWLNRSLAIREKRDGWYESPLNYLLFYEVWDPLRKDRRFLEILDKIGFPKVNSKLLE